MSSVVAVDRGSWTVDQSVVQPSTKTWRVVIDEMSRSASEHMRYDERLAGEATPTVRIFWWRVPSISIGWKQPRPSWGEGDDWVAGGLECVERPTGGGIAFHGSDVSIAVVIPRVPSDSLKMWMQIVCRSAASLCESYGASAACVLDQDHAQRIAYCLTERSPYAVLVNGRKLAGFAARRYPQAWLIQGSLLVHSLPSTLHAALPEALAESLAARAVSLSEAVQGPVSLSDAAHRWAEILLRNISAISKDVSTHGSEMNHQFLRSEN